MAEEKNMQPEWEGVENVLVIMAHPDDPDFTAAGTVIQMADQGINVTYMILTNGDKGNHNPDITRDELIEFRKREQRAAAEVEGVKSVLFMGEEDGFLQPTRELRKRVVREIRRIRPELIMTMNPDRYFSGRGYINHPDHRNAGLVALEAIFPASDNMMFFPELMDEGYMPHKIKQLYVVGVHGDEVDVVVDVTDVMERKIQALICHKTQFTDIDKFEERMRTRWGEEQEDGTIRHFERFKVMKFG
ncbi:MAG: PIG-L deacetylase family protein [Chloroflexota bacterium]